MDISTLLTGRNAALPVAIYVVSQAVKSLVPSFFAKPVGQRLTPLMPILLGVGFALAGLCEGAARWQDKVLVGLIAAFTAGHLFKVGKTSFLGWGVDHAVDPAAASAPSSTPAVSAPTSAVEVSETDSNEQGS